MPFSLSVVVPNLNDARHLPTALDALLSQTQLAQEIIVVDDASSDKSAAIIEDYARRFPTIRPVLRQRTRGVVACMNEFARKATGEYIYFAAADDFVLPGYFAAARRMLEANPAAGLCSALCRRIDEDGIDLGELLSPQPQTDETGYISPQRSRELMLRHDSWVNGNTAIYQRSAILAEGGFRPELHGFTDGFMHRLIVLKYGACFVPQPFVCVRQREGSISHRTNTDAAILAQVVRTASTLMRDDPARRFAPSYVDRWRRRTNFGALRLQLASPDVNLQEIAIPGLSGNDLKLARALRSAGFGWLADAYLFIRMRPFDILSMIEQRLNIWRNGTTNHMVPPDIPVQRSGSCNSGRSA